MTQNFLFTLIGYAGTLAISTSYLVALLGIIEKRPSLFVWLNLIGGVALCFPTYLANTLVSQVLNGFWIIIAVSGLADHYSAGRIKISYRALVCIAGLAGGVVLWLGVPPLLSADTSTMLILGGAMLAMLSFMAGYFCISTSTPGIRVLCAYLAFSMAGNLLYFPILIRDQNWPIFWLQAFCLVAGAIKMLHLQATSQKSGMLSAE